jgi:predicted phosphodiesterase
VLLHGTPLADTVYLLETVHRDGVTLASEEETQSRLGGGAAAQPLVLCGHSHIPRTISCGDLLIVNPGSVGLQAYVDDNPLPHVMATGSPHARYAILEPGGSGWRVDQIQITYNWDAAARAATRNGRQDWAHRLRTGRNR